MKTHRVIGAGGVGLHVAEAGPPDAPPILLIHGWSQHHLCWSKQLSGALAERFRLVAPDLRGHGASDKPDAAEAYQTSAHWAGDIGAIIKELSLDRPILVGWSMGGWVVADHLRAHGDGAISGAVVIGSSVRIGTHADPAVAAKRRPDVRAEATYGTDQLAELRAVIAFVQACFAAPLSKKDLAFMVGFNMLCPPHIRRAARLRDEDFRDAWGRLTKPALIIQGAAERVCLPEILADMQAAIPHARTVTYPGCGHAPFWEQPERFDADLAAFADTALGATA